MCAIVGVFGSESAAKVAYFSLFAMQHRGQEASGIATSDGELHHVIKKKGLVSRVFREDRMAQLTGPIAIGHNRYSTAGKDSLLDAQPVYAKYGLGEISIVHNGNLTNKEAVRNGLIDKGAIYQTNMDTENLIHQIAKNLKPSLFERIKEALLHTEGAYSLVIMSRKKMYAVRDRFGIRPMSLGRLKDGGYIVASETCAFDLVGAEFIRDVEPGEMLIFRENSEPESVMIFEKEQAKKCIFEHVYFARPDSYIYGRSVYESRKEMGKLLARELPVEADMVVPVPDSGVSPALGYSEESGVPFELAIIRNHYVGRTFIEPTQDIRDLKVKMKLSPIKEYIDGKRLIVIDDSIVRGTTSKQIVKMLRDAGAKEIHMRISSPPTKHPCFYGVDTPSESELISSQMETEAICDYIGADSLAYMSLEALDKSVGAANDFCKACFDGQYIE
jgi:amidophosphoribosyltransferase